MKVNLRPNPGAPIRFILVFIASLMWLGAMVGVIGFMAWLPTEYYGLTAAIALGGAVLYGIVRGVRYIWRGSPFD